MCSVSKAKAIRRVGPYFHPPIPSTSRTGTAFASFPATVLSGRNMVGSAELARHVLEFEATTGLHVRVHGEAERVLIVIESAPLPPGCYRLQTTDLLFVSD